MFDLENGRCVFRCDRPGCAIRMDVGPELARDFAQRRLPSGWTRLTANVHYCPMHSTINIPAALRRHRAA